MSKFPPTWWTTSFACNKLGVPKGTLLHLMETGFLKQGIHWRKDVMDGGYLWEIDAIRMALRESQAKQAA